MSFSFSVFKFISLQVVCSMLKNNYAFIRASQYRFTCTFFFSLFTACSAFISKEERAALLASQHSEVISQISQPPFVDLLTLQI